MEKQENPLLKGTFPELSKMKKDEIKQECEMWRNVWTWVPAEVRYYVARSGQQCAFMLRNYQRKLGVLVDTHWELVEIELGLIEKTYDPIRDKHYY